MKELNNASPSLPSIATVLEKFLEEGKKRKLKNCELLKYHPGYTHDNILSVSMHQLMLKHKEKCCDTFLKKDVLIAVIQNRIEEDARE